MLTTNHVLVGAVVGEYIGNPVLAFILAVILHLLLDKVPHFWPEGDFKQGTVMAIDTLATVLILVFLFSKTGANNSIFWGGMGGFSVDAVLVPSLWLNSKAGKWHTKRQFHDKDPITTITDVALIVICVSILLVKGM
jgi:hypothetical protein